jgi:hypothetical protein
MPYLLTPANELAISGNPIMPSISAANLYFFSWFSLMTSFVLWFQHLQINYKVGGDGSNKNFCALLWAGVCLASFVAMMGAVRVYQSDFTCSDSDTSAHCKRTKFAIALGCISSFFSVVWVVMGHKAAAMIDTGFSVIMLIMWAFGVSYITFGNSAPGAFLGNLYFGTWASFILVLQAAVAGLREMFFKDEGDDNQETGTGNTPAQDEEKGDKPAEDLQDVAEIKA